MNRPAEAAEELARRVRAREAHESSPSQAHVGLRAIEKLRLYLAKFVGIAGFQSLLARSLSLTKSHVSWLRSVQVTKDGALTGFIEAAEVRDADDARRAETALLAHLFGLLITFIGETITLQIVRDIWSDVHLDDLNFDAEETT